MCSHKHTKEMLKKKKNSDPIDSATVNVLHAFELDPPQLRSSILDLQIQRKHREVEAVVVARKTSYTKVSIFVK